MLDRLKNLINAVSNNMINKMETPEVLAQQAESELETNLKKLKEALTTSIAGEKMLEQQIKKAQEEVVASEKRATVAVQKGEDEIAKQYLTKKSEGTQHLASLQAQLAAQSDASKSLKERYAEMQEKMREFQRKKTDLTTRAKASDAMAKAHDLTSNSSGSGMDKWEQKIREKEIRGEAMREASGHTAADDQFKAMDEHLALEDELAALKAQVAVPKLVVDKTPPRQDESEAKTVVDDNVPMVVEEIKDDEEGKTE